MCCSRGPSSASASNVNFHFHSQRSVARSRFELPPNRLTDDVMQIRCQLDILLAAQGSSLLDPAEVRIEGCELDGAVFAFNPDIVEASGLQQ